MKKFLALVLTLAMVLTLNVGMIAGAAADTTAPVVDVTGKSTVTVDGVEYTVIDNLAAVATAGNYILSKDVAVPANTVITFAAGTVLNGNGFVISVEGNSTSNPAKASPFALGAGAAITISNVSFGTEDAPILIMSVAPAQEGEPQADVGLFANDIDPTPEYEGEVAEGEEPPVMDPVDTTTATFENVDFNVYYSDKNNANVGGFMAVAYGNYTFVDCDMYCTINAGDISAPDGGVYDHGYVGGYFGRTMEDGMVSFDNCTTVAGSSIVNDWRVAGFVANLKGGVSIVNCTNNASVENCTKVAAGFLGWVEGETLSAFTFDNNVNNGDITAYEGPLTADGKSHGDSSRLAAGLIANIYTDSDNTAPQIVVTNCTNNGFIGGENQLSGLLGMIRVVGTQINTGEKDEAGKDIIEYINDKPVIVENCVNTGDVACIVKDTKASAHVMGGLYCRIWGPTIVENCVNYGSVDGKGLKDSHLGGLVGNLSNPDMSKWGTTLQFVNFVNYGAIINGRRLGGVAGTAETGSTFTNCINFGWIDCGISNAEIAGGINGFADNSTIEYFNCVNLGYVKGATYAGGIMGYTRCNKPETNVTIDGCVNLGAVYTGSQCAGGIAGYSAAPITITNCINAGFVGADSTYVGQILGSAAGTVVVNLGDNKAYGRLADDATPPNLDGMLGFECFNETALVDGCTNKGTILGEASEEQVVGVTLEAALAEMKEMFDDELGLYAMNDSVTYLQPAVRGVQVAREAANGKTTIRFAGVVDSMLDTIEYEKVEFTYKVNEAAAVTVAGTKLDSINAINRCGAPETRTAQNLSGSAIYVVEVADIATTGTVTVEITMTATANGVAYTSWTQTVTVVDGQIA